MYRNFEELFAAAEEKPLYGVILQNEMKLTEETEPAVYRRLEARWQIMQAAAGKALRQPQTMPGNLISGQAQKQQTYAEGAGFAGGAVNRAMALALSCSEVNASMGRICAAPTAGACGVMPAVFITAAEHTGANQPQIMNALLVAAGIGAIITKNATVSGAEGGCQAECGVAAAMAGGAAVFLAGGSNRQIGNAVSIVLMNCMGLVCDPVAGLVQMPCSFRNASQAANALISADMALAGQDPLIPPDEVVEAMYRVGKKLPYELRETALGGIAATPTGVSIKNALQL
ncbi:MAG: L-serine ammonia-lyase, iron-sulfur-dependent, subunit alpha [Oscillospiraceae bacterium]